MSDRAASQITVFARFIRRYLNDYGGARAIFGSPFLALALLLAAISFQRWDSQEWKELALATIPNLLGFSLGTYALLFSLISQRLKKALREVKNSRGVAYLDEMNATFFHFIFMQVLTFAWIIGSNATFVTDIHNFLMNNSLCPVGFMPFLRAVSNIFGMTLFFYSFFLVIAASLTVYRIARLADDES